MRRETSFHLGPRGIEVNAEVDAYMERTVTGEPDYPVVVVADAEFANPGEVPQEILDEGIEAFVEQHSDEAEYHAHEFLAKQHERR